MAPSFWCGVSFGLRPRLCPFALARARPSLVRARISSRSNSARPPKTVSIKRPCAVVVSAHASAKDRKPAFRSVIASSVFNRSRVDRARRSSRVTVRTSPGPSSANTRRSCARSVLAPLAVSRNTFPAPAARSWRTCTVTLCPSVDTRAYPKIIGRLCNRLVQGESSIGSTAQNPCRSLEFCNMGKTLMMISLGQKRLRPVTVIATDVYVVVCSSRNENLQRRTIGRNRLGQMRRAALALAQRRQREAEVVLRRRPVERHPIARPLLQRQAVGRNRLGQMRRAALPPAQPRQRAAEVVLRRRPVERHPIARPLLQRQAVGRNRLGQMRRAALPPAQPRQRAAEVVLRRRPVERHPIARPLLQRQAVGRNRLGQMRRAALPLAQRRQREAEVVLRRRPVARHPIAGQFLQRRTIGRRCGGESTVIASLIPNH